MEAPYSCLIHVRNHQNFIFTTPELGSERGANDFESNALAITPSDRLATAKHDFAPICYEFPLS